MNSTLRILIVEDVPADAELIERRLRKGNMAFTSKRVETKKAFSDALKDFKPDLILSGYSLSTFDGISAMLMAQTRCPYVPFIFVSGEMDEDLAIETLHSGATDYVFKDRLSRLVPAVRRALKEASETKERKQAEQALKESEEEYRNLVDNALVGIYKTNLKGDILYVNDALIRMLEYESPDEVIGGGVLSKYKNPKDRKVLIEKLKKTGRVDNFELEVLTKTGKTKNVLLSAVLDGGILSGMTMDITERKQAEEALRESVKRIRDILDSVALGIALINRDMEITWLNETFRKWFPNIDVEKKPICHKSFYEPPKGEVCDYCPTVKSFKDGKVHAAETGVCADGNIYLVTAAPILDKEGKTTLVIETVTNITERKQAEQAPVNKRTAEFEEKNKELRSKGVKGRASRNPCCSIPSVQVY